MIFAFFAVKSTAVFGFTELVPTALTREARPIPPCSFSPPVQQKGRNWVPASLPHSTLRTISNLYPMRRRRFAPVSYTRSDYCVFASSTPIPYQKACPPHVTSCGDKAGTTGKSQRRLPAAGMRSELVRRAQRPETLTWTIHTPMETPTLRRVRARGVQECEITGLREHCH